MSGMNPEWEISAAFDMRQTDRAAALVDRAMAAIYGARTGTGVTKADAQWQARAARVQDAFREVIVEDLGFANYDPDGLAVGSRKRTLVDAVAQWLSAKAHAGYAQGAREAAERVVKLAEEIATLQRCLAEAGQALQFERTTAAGHDVAGCAYVAERSLLEALPAIQMAHDAAQMMLPLVPTDGRGGVVSKLREAPPNDALALALVHIWKGYGLSDAGGRSGDGLDAFLAEVLGDKAAEKALTKARNSASTKI